MMHRDAMISITTPPDTLATITSRSRDYAGQALSDNTRRAYRADWEGFTAWCAGHALDQLPAAPETIALNITDLADRGRKPSTIQRRLSAISDLPATRGAPDEMLGKIASQLEEIDIAREAISELSDLFNYLAALGVPGDTYELDLSLARGLGYYTGPVFEATVREGNIGSIAGAGRYDGLVGRFSKQQLPATGISLGIERIIVVADEMNLLESASTISDVLVTLFDDGTIPEALKLSSELRRSGLKVETFLEPGKALGQQFRYASRPSIPFAVVLGPDEIEKGKVAIKDLEPGDQVDMDRSEVRRHIEALRSRPQA